MKRIVFILIITFFVKSNADAQRIPALRAKGGMHSSHQHPEFQKTTALKRISSSDKNPSTVFSTGGLIDSTIFWTWDSLASSWSIVSKAIFTYATSDSVTHELDQTWTGTAWNNQKQIFYTY